MAEPPQNLDRLTPELRRDVEALGGEPDFVDFVRAWYGLLDPVEAKHPDTWPYWSSSRQRQVKRVLERTSGLEEGRRQWLDRQAQAKSYRPPLFDMDLFGISLQAANPAHRPFEWRWWLAFRDVKTYFIKLTRRPQWTLLAAIFFGEATYAYAQAEWARRAERFSRFDAEAGLWNLCRFYIIFQPVILAVLSTRIPFFMSPHREEAEKLLATMDLRDLFRGDIVLREPA